MFSDLHPDLQNLVTQFAYNATLDETKEALDFVLTLKQVGLHSACLSNVVGRYSHLPKGYCKATKQWFGRSWMWAEAAISPLNEFFVWFCFDQLFNPDIMLMVLYDVDFRTVRKFTNQRKFDFFEKARSPYLSDILDVSNLIKQLGYGNLKKRPMSIETRRWFVDNHFPHFRKHW